MFYIIFLISYFHLLGTGPIFPFIPVIARDLGFSSVAVGWTSTAASISTIMIKPLLGTFADKYLCHKLMFLFIVLTNALVMFGFRWSPAVPTHNSIDLSCIDGINLSTCSEKLKDKCFVDKVLQSFNSTCMLHVKWRNNVSYPLSNQSLDVSSDSFNHHSINISVQLWNVTIEDSCFSMKSKSSSMNWSSICEDMNTVSTQLYCNDAVLRDLIMKPVMDDSQEMFSYQYLILFILIVLIRVSTSAIYGFGDTLCFSLLGDKREHFGRQRLWTSVGWGVFSMIAGILVDSMSSGKDKQDYTMSFYLSLILLLLDLLVVSFIKEIPQKKTKSIVKDVKQLFRNKRNALFLIWSAICGVYIAFVWFYVFWFIEDLALKNGCESNGGWIKTLEGLVQIIQCYVGEIPFFFMAGKILQKIGTKNSMTLVLFTFGARFLIYSYLTNPWWILPVESFSGITFGLFYATMTTYASTISPPGTEATIQNLVGGVFEGAGCSTGALLGGYLFKALGSSRTFFYIGLSAVIFAILHIIFQNIFEYEETVYYTEANANPDEKHLEKIKNDI